jgi:hypothetical protein
VIEAHLTAVDESLNTYRAVVGSVPARRVHAYLSAPNSSAALADVRLRVQRRGFLTAALVIGAINTSLLVVAAAIASDINGAPTTAPLLLAVPGALAGFLSRQGEHPLTGRLLAGTRLLLLALGLCSFAGAMLVTLDLDNETLRDWLWFIAAVTLDLFLLVVVSYLFPRPRRRAVGVAG